MKLYIKQHVFTFRDKFDVKNANMQTQYSVKGKIFALSKRFTISDRKNKDVAKIKKRIFTWFPNYKIKTIDNHYTLKRKFSFFKHRYIIKELNWIVEGDFLNHQYHVKEGKKIIMNINKHWLRWGDSYELDIRSSEFESLLLAVAICIDAELASDKEFIRKQNQQGN